MEFHPRYPQPFTFDQAIALDPAVASDEIVRLQNSLSHLKRSQHELKEYLQGLASPQEDPEVGQAIKENETTIASQDERIFMLKLALTHHGLPDGTARPMSQHCPSPSTFEPERSRSNVRSGVNGLDDTPSFEDTQASSQDRRRASNQEGGMYL
ncbi:hypothetical protein F5I97DRAFT_869032 [Phlebopus sp. FC_14]|nr:hypothetical protein F5I97DRAFT_869032 [Phlebopus sp. FC_14]